ncbi:MAG: hypothetical protein Q9166_007871 [cf. Caloplaca sp. 2 TL-2023]
MSAFHVRPPQTTPQHTQGASTVLTSQQPPWIIVRHPAYLAPGNVLLRLPRIDSTNGAFHQETLRIACGIIAGNRWDGFFTEQSPQGPRISTTQLLLQGSDNYYFHLPNNDRDTSPYPVVPSFAEWSFPHGNLPLSWTFSPENPNLPVHRAASNTDIAIIARDGSCRMTQQQEGCEVAHLCPKVEKQWFIGNSMTEYTRDNRITGLGAISDTSNLLLLRKDLHFLLDKAKFAFVPKAATGDEPAKMVVHILVPSQELTWLFHNVELQPIDGVAPEFLLTRFAWAIFPLFANFMVTNTPRRVRLSTGVIRTATIKECQTFLSPSQDPSESQSSAKRQRSQSRANIGPRAASQSSLVQLSDDHTSRPRGRKRRRSTESHTTDSVEVAKKPRRNFLKPLSKRSYDRHRTLQRDNLNKLPKLKASVPTPNHSAQRPAAPEPCASASKSQSPPPSLAHTSSSPVAQAESRNLTLPNLAQLRGEWLEKERERSGGSEPWATETAWLRARLEEPISPRDMPRFLKGLGWEIPEHEPDGRVIPAELSF